MMESQTDHDMKQQLLSMLSTKNKRVAYVKHDSLNLYPSPQKSTKQLKIPIKMSKYERNKWLFDILSTGNNESEQQKQLEDMREVYIKISKLLSKCRAKQIKWNNKRQALKNEIEFLKQLLVQEI